MGLDTTASSSRSVTGTDGPHRRLAGWLTERLGGPARSKVIAVLAGVLALDAADKGMLGAVAVQLQHDLGIGKTQVGLLLSVTSGVAAVATLAAGGMVDRMHRTRLLAVAIALWGVAMVAGSLATSFVFLLLTRLFLGAVAAVAGPAVASLIGDLFPIRERGRIYGLVLAGELVGTGFGLVVSGQIAAAAGWRPAFWALAVPPVALALLVWRLREPARGGASQIPRGATEIPVPGGQGPRPAGGSRPAGDGSGGGTDEEGVRSGSTAPDARRVVGDFGVQPDAARVLGEDPRRMPLWRVVRYVLRIRTNVALIVASALGYFYFNGVRGFAAQWAQQQYDVSLATAIGFVPVIGIGALVGVFVGGRLGDRLLGRGRLSGRVLVGSVAFVATALAIAPALLSHALVIGFPP